MALRERCYWCDGHLSHYDVLRCKENRNLVETTLKLIEVALTGIGFTSEILASDRSSSELVIYNPRGIAFTIILTRGWTLDKATCSRCKKQIPDQDINTYREESNSLDLPDMCVNCAEIEE